MVSRPFPYCSLGSRWKDSRTVRYDMLPPFLVMERNVSNYRQAPLQALQRRTGIPSTFDIPLYRRSSDLANYDNCAGTR